MPSLTPRQLEIVPLVAQGLKNGDIAVLTGTTEHDIKNYLRALYNKLGLWNRVELALWWVRREHENITQGPPRPSE